MVQARQTEGELTVLYSQSQLGSDEGGKVSCVAQFMSFLVFSYYELVWDGLV